MCICCQNKNLYIDYKQTDVLRKFVSGTFKIASSYKNDLCKKHQRQIARSIKLARFMALMPYTRNQVTKR